MGKSEKSRFFKKKNRSGNAERLRRELNEKEIKKELIQQNWRKNDLNKAA
jgi:hypothetical protein